MGSVTRYVQKLGMGVNDNENQSVVAEKIARILVLVFEYTPTNLFAIKCEKTAKIRKILLKMDIT